MFNCSYLRTEMRKSNQFQKAEAESQVETCLVFYIFSFDYS